MASLNFLESRDWPKLMSFFLVVSSSIGDGAHGFSGAVISAYKTVEPMLRSAFLASGAKP